MKLKTSPRGVLPALDAASQIEPGLLTEDKTRPPAAAVRR